ncbi:hypothetical protein [Clostridium sp. KNHs214]|uniref:hypothetical protein n=1 Tax=Clostridium sp. KNHs214 TaxID=1540257 RepID=UPI000A789C00|nr:hypothetical protein [Clostridium sp. KNHs214]
MYTYNTDGTYKTNAYRSWIRNFPTEEVPSREDYEIWEGIDFNKPIELFITYVCKDGFDIRNFDKATIDQIFNRCLEVDDNIVESVHSEKVGSCNNYEDGKISFFIRNL